MYHTKWKMKCVPDMGILRRSVINNRISPTPRSGIYHSRRQQVRRSHQGSPVRHRRASAGEHRRRSWGNWRALEHTSLSLGGNKKQVIYPKAEEWNARMDTKGPIVHPRTLGAPAESIKDISASVERNNLYMHDAALINTCQAFSILNSIFVINICPLCRRWLEGSNQLMA